MTFVCFSSGHSKYCKPKWRNKWLYFTYSHICAKHIVANRIHSWGCTLSKSSHSPSYRELISKGEVGNTYLQEVVSCSSHSHNILASYWSLHCTRRLRLQLQKQKLGVAWNFKVATSAHSAVRKETLWCLLKTLPSQVSRCRWPLAATSEVGVTWWQ